MQKSGRADSRAKTYPSRENALGSAVHGHLSHSHSLTLLNEVDLGGSCWKMSRDFSHPTMVQISDGSLGRLPNSGMAWRGAPLTLAISVLHNDEGASLSSATVTTLSMVLEPNAPRRFSLSAKAAAGILRRADRREKTLPESLRHALETLAATSPQPSPQNGQREAGDRLATKPKTSPSVRRLTPMETERLMGWPDGWTIVESWGKPTMGIFKRKKR